jgi:hypothetical protein
VHAKKTQTISFTSTAPSSAVIGGPTYTVSATGGGSGNPVVFSIDASSSSVCSIAGAVVTFTGVGTCTIDANQSGNASYEAAAQAQQSFAVSKKAQAIKFTSTAPSSAVIGGPSYTVSATGGGSGNPVVFSIDASSSSVCSISGALVSFTAAGTCKIDANQSGNASYEAAPQAQQSFTVHAEIPQAITFTSTPPSAATVGGPTYTVTATGGGSGNPVVFSIDASSSSVCSISGAVVSFTGAGTCTVDANQEGNGSYEAAPEAQQSFAVSAAPVPVAPGGGEGGGAGPPVAPLVSPIPNNIVTITGARASRSSGAVTLTVTVGDPGTLRWRIVFRNGRFGAFTARARHCRPGAIRRKHRCLPAFVAFAGGSASLSSAGSWAVAIKPGAAARKALRRAARRHKGLKLSVQVTFQSALGGSPGTAASQLVDKLRRR